MTATGQTARMDQDTGDPSPPSPPRVDYRFLLANERTFLAYARTALSLQVAGLGVLQFLTHGHELVRYVLGVALVAAGTAAGVAGFHRFRHNEQAIRAGEELGPTPMLASVLTGVLVLPLIAALVLAVAAAF